MSGMGQSSTDVAADGGAAAPADAGTHGSATAVSSPPGPSNPSAAPAAGNTGEEGAKAGAAGVSPPPSEGGAAEPASEPSSAAAAAPAADPKEDWRERRIRQLTARLREQEKLGEGAMPPSDGAQAAPTQEEIQRQVQAEAARLAAVNEFNRECNAAVEAGKAAFGAEQFNSRVAELRKIADMQNPAEAQAYTALIQSVLETGEAPKVLFQLGADLNLASELLALSPTKRAMKLAQLALAKGEPEPSAAPKPVTPIRPKADGVTPIAPSDASRADNLSMAEWMKRREAEVAEKRKQGMRIY